MRRSGCAMLNELKARWRKETYDMHEDFEQVSRSRIKQLKDVLARSNAVIFTCGPSLNNISTNQIQELIDKGYIIICVKQAIERMPNKFAHFHLVNFCNEYVYKNISEHTIRIYCQRSENTIIQNPPYDIILSHFPNNLNDNIITSMKRGDDAMSFDALVKRPRLKVKWGDIMYELSIPLAIYIGCSNIYIVGWDCKNFKQHFYGTDNRAPRNNLRIQLDMLQIEGGALLHDFVKKNFNSYISMIGNGDESIFDLPYTNIEKLL